MRTSLKGLIMEYLEMVMLVMVCSVQQALQTGIVAKQLLLFVPHLLVHDVKVFAVYKYTPLCIFILNELRSIIRSGDIISLLISHTVEDI